MSATGGDWLWDYPTPFLFCRAWGHRWTTRGAFLEGLVIVHCDCGTEARDHFTQHAFVRYGQRGYTWPKGYLPAPDRIDARKEWFRRFPVAAERADQEEARARA